MTDLIQILDPHLTRGTARDQQDADRFDITIRGLRDPRPDNAARAASIASSSSDFPFRRRS
jgi:hypothetical protein